MEKTFMARKMEKVGPDQEQGFTGCGRSVARGRPAGAWGRAYAPGARTGTRAHAGKERRR
jgi:hypothetical protein